MYRILILILLITATVSFSQSRFTYDGLLISLKAGYHFNDDNSTLDIVPYNQSIPGGFSVDGTAEMHTGKGWYLGFNYDFSLAKDELFDEYYIANVKRSIEIYSFSPILKYRVLIKNYSINFGFGIGGSSVTTTYNVERYDKNRDGMINYNARVGFDYAISKSILISTEAVYYGMSELSFHGSGRVNQIFQLKTGLTVTLPKK